MSNLWNETIWKGINDEVRKLAGTIRVAQKVFPTVMLDNPSSIPDDAFNLANFTIAEGLTKPFIEISAPFTLTPNQVAYEASLQTGLKLAKLRAGQIGQVEDLIFFQGTLAAMPPGIPVPANIQSAGAGLLGLATPIPGGYQPPNAPVPVAPVNPRVPGVYGQNTFNAVVTGISELNQNLQPGPFALFLHSSVFADTYAAYAPSFILTADRITPLVTGGFFGTTALPAGTGLLMSLGGEPTTLYIGVDVTVAFTLKDAVDNHSFRVFERVQFNARDPRAFVRLNFL
jgi:Encapsulating protein for peroxidase